MVMKYPNRLTACRETTDLTRAGVADRLKVTERTVYRWEIGQNQIPDNTKRELAALFGVTTSELMGWDERVAA